MKRNRYVIGYGDKETVWGLDMDNPENENRRRLDTRLDTMSIRVAKRVLPTFPLGAKIYKLVEVKK